jgi:hypothetical protein
LVLSTATASTSTSTGGLIVAGGAGFGENIHGGGTLTIAGNGAINGSQLTTTSSTFNLINSGATTLNIGGAATTLSIGSGSGTSTFNGDVNAASGKVYKINGTTVLSATTLGSGVTSSSLTTVGNVTNLQTTSLGVGTAASGTAGEIRATNNITAYYSDDRLKTKLGGIENALDKLCSLSGFYYEANQTAQDLGYEVKREVGVSAQQVQAILPEVVAPAPIDENYLTVRYERLAPLFIEAIKELREEVRAIKAQLEK